MKIGSTLEITKWGKLVKFSHTIFALPFALSMLFVVQRDFPVSMSKITWILICLVSARTGAMTLNRIIDRNIDGLNPRTRNRELPQGIVTLRSVQALLLLSYGIFLGAAAMLGRHTLILAPFVLAILSFYSWTKRWTSWSHLVLGACLAMAPGGVWYALTGIVSVVPLWLMLGVALWVAGFDIIYSCQDMDFDRSQGLFSIPARIGLGRALNLARILHFMAVISIAIFGIYAELGSYFFIGLIVFSAVLFSQHGIVSENNLSRVNEAFFVRNGMGSVVFMIGTLIDCL